MKNSLKILFVLLASISFLLFSCSDYVSESGSSNHEEQYGSLTVQTGSVQTSDGRALDIAGIDKADVTLYVSKTKTFKVENVSVSAGSGTATLSNIPFGTNYVVVVEAKTTAGSISSKIAGTAISAVTDIKSAANTVSVTWDTTAVGNVFYQLIQNGYTGVSSLSSETVAGYLPKENERTVHASLIDTALLSSDIQAGTVKDASVYKLSAGTVTFTANAAVSGATVQVCDQVSSKLTTVASGTNTISNVAPGTWKVFALVGSTTLYSNSCTVESGETVDLGAITFKTPSPRLENASGKEISEFISGTTTVYLKARTYDDEEEPSGVVIYYTTDGSVPSAASTRYTSSGISVSAGTTVKAIAVCSGLSDSEVSSWTFAASALGYTHPSSGDCSVVEESSWASASYPLGAQVSGGNTTFALYSANATKVLLEIYDAAYGENAKYDYWMTKNTSTSIWNAKLTGDLSGKIYAFRVWGPNWEFSEDWARGGSDAGFKSDCDASGNRFNPNKVVFDPYAREMTHDPSNATAIASYKTTNSDYALTKPEYQILSTGETKPTGSTKAWREFDSGTISPKGYIISDSTGYGTKPQIAQKDAIIYEAHVRGITKHSSATSLSTLLSGYDGFENVVDIPEEYRGTYKGAALLVPYLKALGVNTIELLPVHETDNDANPDDGPGGNFWGYMTFDYFAPDRRYSSDKTAGGPTKEFKEA